MDVMAQISSTSPATGDSSAVSWAVAIVIVVLGLVAYYVYRKTRPLPGEHVFLASRVTRGNRLFPSQVQITSSSVTMFKPQWVGKLEESIHIAHISSIKIDTNMVFSDVLIETTGGHNPMVLHGHTKGDAVKMKQVIEKFQSEYFKKA